MVHIDQQVYPPYRIGLTRQKVGRNRKRPRLTLHLDFPKGEHMDTPKHFKHAPCTLKFPHMSAFWTFVKLAQISTFSPIERFRIALQCVQPRALQAPINTRPPRKFAPQNTSTAQGVLVLRVVLTACTTMNVCSPKVLATVRVSPTQLSVLPDFYGCSCAQCWCCAVRCDVRASRAAWCLGGWHYPPSLAAALPLLGGVAGYVARRTPSFVATANDVQVGLPLQGDLHLSTQGGLGRCRPRRRRDLVVAASSNTTTGTARCPAAATARCCECPFGMVL